jgi:hypothetical protein
VGFLLHGVRRENPCRHQKVLVFYLDLTVFVRHLFKLVKQVLQTAPQENKIKKKKKKVKMPLHSKSLQTLSLFS